MGWRETARIRGGPDLLEEKAVAVERHHVVETGNEAQGRLPVRRGMRERKPDGDFVLLRLPEGRDAGDGKNEVRPIDVDPSAGREAAAEVVGRRDGDPMAQDLHVGGRRAMTGGAPHLAGLAEEAPAR